MRKQLGKLVTWLKPQGYLMLELRIQSSFSRFSVHYFNLPYFLTHFSFALSILAGGTHDCSVHPEIIRRLQS